MKLNSSFIYTTLMILFCQTTFAQTTDSSLKASYEQKTIRFLSPNSHRYVQNGEKKNPGIFYQKLKKEFEIASPEAQKEIALTVKQWKTGTILGSIGYPLYFVGLVMILSPAGTLGIVMWATGAALFVPAVVYSFVAQRHLYKAVWLYNRDVLIGK
jgi:hypothetical protein